MRNLFVKSGELSEVFPYRSKAIFAFQEIDGVDLCFFGMYVQEYGSECPDPNTRRVYIEFLDSVNFFQPKSFRTDIYHEILLGYMDFAKQLGYEWLHIWACPPPSGENYIFFGHPPDQKVPDSLRLQRWYTNVLRKGKSENIVVGYKNILEQYKDDVLSQGSIETKEANVAAVARLPYFDEDYWPYFFEETIGKMDEKLKSAKSRQKRSSCKRKTKKQNDNNAAARMNRQRSGLRSKLFSTMAELSESFFSVQLHSAESAATLAPIRDPDSLINNPILNGHSAFFDFARDNSYEFSSLRRAKFSTMLLLYELYNQEIKTEHYVCNVCELRVRTWYHCTVCEDYDLCVDCNEKTGHEHEMHKMGLQSIAEASTSHSDVISIDSDSDGDEILLSDLVTKSKVSSSDSPPASSETVEQSDPLVTIHAGQCTDRDCPIPSCQMVKRFARHLKSCRKTNDNCHICKTLNTVLLSHSDNCRNVNCSFSFCKSTRAQIQRELEQQREKENVDNVMKIAATLQKTSLKMLEHRDVFTDPQFLLNIAFDISNVQIQLQKLIAANYVDCAARIENAPELRFNSRSG